MFPWYTAVVFDAGRAVRLALDVLVL
jgi:hypothetical protein